MKRRLLIAMVLGLAAADVFASSAGTTALPILQFGAGARGLAMGGAYTTLAEGAESLFWNPAGLASNSTVDVTLNHQPLMKVLTYDAGAVAWPTENFGFGAGYAQLASQSIDSLDASGNATGAAADTKDQTFAAGAARRWNGWQTGLAGRWIRSAVADASASTWALSMGVESPLYVDGRLRSSFTLRNLGGKIRYDGPEEKLPLEAALGTAFYAFPALRFSADLLQSASGTGVAAGSEYEIPLVERRWVGFLRAGYSTLRRDVGSGLSLGGGLNLNGLRFDLAWIPMNDFGSSEVFTLSYRFREGSPERPARVKKAPAPRIETPAPVPQKVPQARPVPIPPPPAEQPASAPAFKNTRVYVVKPGDTLASIAKKFYGNPHLWTEIYAANKFLIDDPKNITVGQKILIPIGD